MSVGSAGLLAVSVGHHTRVLSGALLLLCLCAFWLTTADQALHAIESDTPVYFRAATNLLDHGVLSRADPAKDRAPASENYLVPGYPGFLAAIAAIAPDTRDTIRCYAKTPGGPCDDQPLRAIVQAQKGLWLIGLCGIFLACACVLRSPLAGVAGCALVLATGVPGEMARRLMTESLCFTALFCFAAVLAVAHLRDRWYLWLTAGGLLALAVLVRPSFQVLIPATAVLVVAALVLGRSARWTSALTAGALVIAGSLIVLSPWLARNAIVVGEVAISASYGSSILLERLAYNAMTWQEWIAAFVYWLPDFGDDLGRALFGADTVARLDFYAPEAYYNTDPDLPPPPAGGSEFLHYLRVGVLQNIADHVLVSLPMMVRGARVGDYLFLAALLLVWPALKYLRATASFWTFAMVAGPPVLMLAVHALLSVSVPRYNLGLVLVYAIIVLAAGLQFWRWRPWRIGDHPAAAGVQGKRRGFADRNEVQGTSG